MYIIHYVNLLNFFVASKIMKWSQWNSIIYLKIRQKLRVTKEIEASKYRYVYFNFLFAIGIDVSTYIGWYSFYKEYQVVSINGSLNTSFHLKRMFVS